MWFHSWKDAIIRPAWEQYFILVFIQFSILLFILKGIASLAGQRELEEDYR